MLMPLSLMDIWEIKGQNKTGFLYQKLNIKLCWQD
jgi:hypothetical protein